MLNTPQILRNAGLKIVHRVLSIALRYVSVQQRGLQPGVSVGEPGRDFMGANGSKRLVLTVFNRYTGLRGEGSWCKAGSGSYSGCPILLSTNTLLKKNDKQLLTKNICELLSENSVSYINGLEQLRYVDCKLISK